LIGFLFYLKIFHFGIFSSVGLEHQPSKLCCIGSSPIKCDLKSFLMVEYFIFFLRLLFDFIIYEFGSFESFCLSCLLTLPLIGTFFVYMIPLSYLRLAKLIALNTAGLIFIVSLICLNVFDPDGENTQMRVVVKWLFFFNLNINFGIDGVSIFFLVLTSVLILLCILVSWTNTFQVSSYLICFLGLEFLLLCVFSVLDLLVFYILFESVLIPMFLIIGIWGSRQRKVRASYFLFLYTVLGSILMLIAILYIYTQVGSTHYEVLITFRFSFMEQLFLWIVFFISFATKVPMIPVHLWLPEAHVEAPTTGSVILAGILLKLGIYGFIRFLLPLFPEASFYYSPLIYTLALIGIVLASFTAIRQTDFKRIIAYTSVAHMNLVVLGIFSFNLLGLSGSILQSISHGFVASALFLLIGIVYERHGSRMIKYYGGLVHVMPLYTSMFLFFTMSNIGLPGTGSFIGEFLILLGLFKYSVVVTTISATSIVFGGCYSLWLFNRIVYGNLKTIYIQHFEDLSHKDLFIFLPLFLGTFVLGIFPNLFLKTIKTSVIILTELLYF
jgi:proton-translocating NADH-quinone oxidoreductase chain M